MNPRFKADQSEQKLRGGYYTPNAYAEYVAKWVLEKNPQHILEPSCGDGAFVRASEKYLKDKKTAITCFELMQAEAEKVIELGAKLDLPGLNVQCQDFIEYANKLIKNNDRAFDAIVGNPPFIRYQFIEPVFQERAEECFKLLGQKFTKLTNSWVVFIFACIALLKEGGRLGMVIPSEILHVLHAKELRKYIMENSSTVMVINPKELWFKGTSQGTVMLLLEKKKNQTLDCGLGLLNVQDDSFLAQSIEDLFADVPFSNDEGKWTEAMLTKEEKSLYENLKQNTAVKRFGELAKPSVAITSGANEFFLVNDETIKEFGLATYAHPIFSNSRHCKGLIYDEDLHKKNKQDGEPVNYVLIDDHELSGDVWEYIELGELSRYHERYKCKIRSPWFKAPNVVGQDGCINKFSHECPKLVVNRISAYTTDGFYRVQVKDNVSIEKMSTCFLNPFTMLCAELEGRFYGGGVLELTPSEITKICIPYDIDLEVNLEYLNQLIQTDGLVNVVYNHGRKVLSKIGVQDDQYELIFDAWIKLKNVRQRKD